MRPSIREAELALAEVEDLLGLESGLTEWEANFVDDLSRRPPSEFTRYQIRKIH